MTVRVTFFCMCCFLAAVPLIAVAQEERPELSDDARTAIEAGQWEEVTQLLEPLIASDPGEQVQYWYGVARLELGDAAGAAPHLTSSLSTNPGSIPCARKLARCALAMGDTRAATTLAEQFPADATVALLAGRTCLNAFYPEKAKAAGNWGFRPLDSTNLQSALVWLERAVALDSDAFDTHRWYAFALHEARDTTMALEHAERAIAIGPAGWELYSLASYCLEQWWEYEDAIEAIKHAIELAPHKRADLEFKRGELLVDAEQYREAIEAFKTVMQLDFKHRSVRYWLGRAAYGAGDFPLALWAFAESRAVDSNIDSLYWTGRVHYDLQNYEDAKRLFQESITQADAHELRPNSDWKHYLGRARWHLGEHDAAMHTWKQTFKYNENNLIYARWLYQGYIEQDNPYDAIDLCWQVAVKGGYPEVAIEGIKGVMRKWPTPRLEDRQAGHRRPHTVVAAEAMTEIEFMRGHNRTAAALYEAQGRHQGRTASPNAGWAFLAIGDHRSASRAFIDFARFATEEWDDFGYLGSGCSLLLRGHTEQAISVLSKIENVILVSARDTALFWANVNTGAPDVAESADALTLLGVVGWIPDEDSGFVIRVIVPGSPLSELEPALRPSDRLNFVGEHWLRDQEGIAALREADIPDQPIRLVIEREDTLVEYSIDLKSALHRIASAPPTDEAGIDE